MATKLRHILTIALLATSGTWLPPAHAIASPPAPAAPTRLKTSTYYENYSSVVQYDFYDRATNETGFEIFETEGSDYSITRYAADHPGRGKVREWWFFYPGSTPITVCARVRAYNRADSGVYQYSRWSNRSCSTLR
jgi:hypothetical protein